MTRISVILLLHQDNEIGIFDLIEEKTFKTNVKFIYLTIGCKNRIKKEATNKRNIELIRVLTKFGFE